jgi:hypothetical protein
MFKTGLRFEPNSEFKRLATAPVEFSNPARQYLAAIRASKIYFGLSVKNKYLGRFLQKFSVAGSKKCFSEVIFVKLLR